MPASTFVTHPGPQLYSLIHKGIRARLYAFSTRAGKVNYANTAQVGEFSADFAALCANIRLHHTAEEEFIHPLVSDRIPGGAVRLEEEHRLVDEQLKQMSSHLAGLAEKTAAFERYKDLGLEFYLSYNRFVAFFLQHIDDEEEHIQRSLFDLCTAQELGSTFGRILASQKPEHTAENLKTVFAAANLDDLTSLFMGAKSLVPPEAYANALRMAQEILEPSQWAELKGRLGLG
jgi:hemerythrin-like domain-containing protein